jgi:hypothetical protein
LREANVESAILSAMSPASITTLAGGESGRSANHPATAGKTSSTRQAMNQSPVLFDGDLLVNAVVALAAQTGQSP